MKSGKPGNFWLGVWYVILLCLFTSGITPAEEKPALRIVTLAPNLTETVFALGHGGDVVGVTDYCRFPEEAKSRKKVGGLFNANAETILSLQPNLVLLPPSQRKIFDAMNAAKIRTTMVETETVDDIYATTLKVGEAIGEDAAAKKLVDEMKAGVAAMKEKNTGHEKVRTLFVVGYSSEGMREIYGVGPATFLDELMTMAGGENILGDSSLRYPVVAREFLIANPPDLIIDANGDGKGPRSDENKAIVRDNWRKFFGENAKKQPRIAFLDDPHVTIPGPAFLESAEKLRKMITP